MSDKRGKKSKDPKAFVFPCEMPSVGHRVAIVWFFHKKRQDMKTNAIVFIAFGASIAYKRRI